MRRYTQNREEYLRSIRRLQKYLGNMHFSNGGAVISVEELFKSGNGNAHGVQETAEGAAIPDGPSFSAVPDIYAADVASPVIERPSIFRKSYKPYMFRRDTSA